MNSIHKALFEALALNNGNFIPGEVEAFYRGKTDRRIRLSWHSKPDALLREQVKVVLYTVGSHNKARGSFEVCNTHLLPSDHLLRTCPDAVRLVLLDYSNVMRGGWLCNSNDLNDVEVSQKYLDQFNQLIIRCLDCMITDLQANKIN